MMEMGRRRSIASSSSDEDSDVKDEPLPTNTAVTVTEITATTLQPLVMEEERETWSKKVDFLLSVIGFAVDLANVWRFPYLCYKNGGGAFLIPYGIMLIVGGIPLFYMELALGQYNRKGAITCWGRLVPLFKGIGYAVALIAFYVDFYYNVIIAWALRFFFASFTSDLPWTNCDNPWNTPLCKEIGEQGNMTALIYNSSFFTTENPNYTEISAEPVTASGVGTKPNFTSPAEEYFQRYILELQHSKGIEDLGRIKPDMAACLLAVYVICYFSLWKGISTSGKVVWFTALFPYFVLIILLIHGIQLPGAYDGIRYYLSPNFDAIYKPEVWVDAATQVFFSLGPGFGVLLAFASYNKFHNNVYLDALMTSCINSATSFVAGFVIFSVLGYMADKTGKPIQEVATEGPGLVFVVYPAAIATMPGSTFWALIFFMMLLTLGLDSSTAASILEEDLFLDKAWINYDPIEKRFHCTAPNCQNKDGRFVLHQMAPHMLHKHFEKTFTCSNKNASGSECRREFSQMQTLYQHISGFHQIPVGDEKLKNLSEKNPHYVQLQRYLKALQNLKDARVFVPSQTNRTRKDRPGRVENESPDLVQVNELMEDFDGEEAQTFFGGSEAIITALSDEFPLIRAHRELFVLALFSLYFIVGLASCSQGGFYFFNLLERYAAGYSILFAVFFEAIAVSWIYGIDRFSSDIREMMGFYPGIYWRVCWKFVAPIFILFIIVYGLVGYEPLTHEGYIYPHWANVLGWCIASSSVAMIPGMAIFKLATTKGTFRQRLKFLTTPWRDTAAAGYTGVNVIQTTTLNGVQSETTRLKSNIIGDPV